MASRKEVVLDVEGPTAPVRIPGGYSRGSESTTKVNRQDFGVSGTPTWTRRRGVGDSVNITIDLEMIKQAAK